MGIFGAMTGKMVQLGHLNRRIGAVLETPADTMSHEECAPMTIPQSTSTPETTQEEWRPVVGYEGTYEVSTSGRVRRVVACRASHAGRVLRPQNSGKGYQQVQLSRNGKARHHYLHVLVATAFIGPCPPGQEVNHKDLNRSNCQLSNLEYLTRSDNVRHAYQHPLRVRFPIKARTLKTHCKQGHKYTPKNTYVGPRGIRVCITCQHAFEYAYRQARKAKTA